MKTKSCKTCSPQGKRCDCPTDESERGEVGPSAATAWSRVVCDSVTAGECDGCELSVPADHGKRYPLKYGWCWHREINVHLNPANAIGEARAESATSPKTDALTEEIKRNNWQDWHNLEKMEEHAKNLECSNNKLRHQRRLLLKRVKEMGSDLAEARRIAKDACAMLASEGYEVNYPPIPWEENSPENVESIHPESKP